MNARQIQERVCDHSTLHGHVVDHAALSRNYRIVRNHLGNVGATFARHSPPLLTEFAAIASTRDQFVAI